MTRRPCPRGFTLAEVLVALAITAFIGGMVWGSFNQGFKAKEMIEAEAGIYRELRTGTARMVREISMAFISENYDTTRFRDFADRPTFFTGEGETLGFSMLGHQRLLRDAKETVLGLARAGYKRLPPRSVRVPGVTGIANFKLALWSMEQGHQISEHDAKVGGWLAKILCGGPVAPGARVSEQLLLDLELEAFMSLVGEPKTLERMQHMLENNKPLRN